MNINEIEVLQIALTSRCNGKCYMCPRNIYETKNYDVDMKILDNLPLKDIKKIMFTGLTGDPIFYKYGLINFIERVQKENPNMVFSMSTNGSIHGKNWWEKLGKLFAINPKGNVYFTLDGLEDTHHIYRGTNFKTVVRNLEHFVNAGGKAIWQAIAFKYNEHQVDEMKKRAEDLGAHFIWRMSRQYEHDDGPFSKPSIVKFKSRGEMSEYYKAKGAKIHCFIKDRKEIFVNVDNMVYPCCWVCCRMGIRDNIDIRLLLKYREDIKKCNLLEYNLEEALKSSYFQYIEKNAGNVIISGRNICDQCHVFFEDMVWNRPDEWKKSWVKKWDFVDEYKKNQC